MWRSCYSQCGAAAIASVAQTKIFVKGLIFVKHTDILLSRAKWTIAVNIALYNYAALVELTRSMLSYIRQIIQVQWNPKSYSFLIHCEELNRQDKIFWELKKDSKSL